MTVQPHLLALCLKHDRKAEYELYRISYGYLMSICMRYARDKDSASEALNMGYLKILNNLSTYKPDIPFKAWIRRIMVNTLIDEFRKNRREKETLTYVEDYFDTADYSEVNEALSRLSYAQIMEEVEKLPEATRRVFNLYVIDGFSHREIATMLGISEGTSKWHVNAARQKLRSELEHMTLSKVQV
jgi:RNA polymerase sigma factor (sigma-70 family)